MAFIVRPIPRREAKQRCEDHPHARTLPQSSMVYLGLYLDGRFAGLAVWGYGIVPRQTPEHLFGKGNSTIDDYLELCRFFVYDWVPKNTASKFLSVTHRLIRKHMPQVKWLYTYAAGFQGLIGTIYQAANYDYIGKTLTNSFYWIPNVGLVHDIALWHRYGTLSDKKVSARMPGIRKWCGHNFRYIYWLCSAAEKQRFLSTANFTIEPYPTAADLQIWTESLQDRSDKQIVPVALAKTIPIVKLPTTRASAGEA